LVTLLVCKCSNTERHWIVRPGMVLHVKSALNHPWRYCAADVRTGRAALKSLRRFPLALPRMAACFAVI
jgi:hypothetical protein